MNNRSKILVNPKFQYKYVLMTAGFAFFISMVIGGLSYYLFRDVMVTFLNQYHQHTPELLATLNGALKTTGFKLGLVLIGFIGAMSYVAIRVTHKASGPIYKLINEINEIIETGDYSRSVNFREYDDFKELETSFNNLLVSINSRESNKEPKKVS